MSWQSQDIEAAHEELFERLRDGMTVNGLSLADLMDADFNERGRAAVSEVYILLASVAAFARDEHTHVERRVKVREYMDLLAKKYLAAHPDLVREHALEMLHAEVE